MLSPDQRDDPRAGVKADSGDFEAEPRRELRNKLLRNLKGRYEELVGDLLHIEKSAKICGILEFLGNFLGNQGQVGFVVSRQYPVSEVVVSTGFAIYSRFKGTRLNNKNRMTVWQNRAESNAHLKR